MPSPGEATSRESPGIVARGSGGGLAARVSDRMLERALWAVAIAAFLLQLAGVLEPTAELRIRER
jgi:hypothetical protein